MSGQSEGVAVHLELPRSPLRLLVVAAAVAAAAAHVPVIGPHLQEAPYMGVLFILLTTACLLLAAGLLVSDRPELLAAAAAVCGAAIVGYCLTRLVAFPQLADDVGNWGEPLGVVSVLSESVVVAASGLLLRRRRRVSPAGEPARRR